MCVSNSKNRLNRMILLLIAAAGVETTNLPAATNPEPAQTLVAICWTGAEKVAADTNSASLKDLMGLPESLKLKEQTLEKLSRAPWVLKHVSVDTNASILLRPLVEDVMNYG